MLKDIALAASLGKGSPVRSSMSRSGEVSAYGRSYRVGAPFTVHAMLRDRVGFEGLLVRS